VLPPVCHGAQKAPARHMTQECGNPCRRSPTPPTCLGGGRKKGGSEVAPFRSRSVSGPRPSPAFPQRTGFGTTQPYPDQALVDTLTNTGPGTSIDARSVSCCVGCPRDWHRSCFPPPFWDATPRPLRILAEPPFPLEHALHSVLSLTLLHYGSLRPPRLPITIHYSDKIAHMPLRGIKPKELEGSVPYWL